MILLISEIIASTILDEDENFFARIAEEWRQHVRSIIVMASSLHCRDDD
jgi:hypothetical protein